MADQQYDMPRDMWELFKKKQEQRAAAKEFWRKHLYNPYIQRRPFDPVLFRYIGLSTYSGEHLRPNIKRKVGFLYLMTPFLLFGYLVHTSRKKEAEKLLSGTVSYEERTKKLLY